MKRVMLAMAVVLGASLCGGLHPAAAQDDPGREISLPGLQSDAAAYMATLRQAFPAGASDDQKSRAADAARTALRSGDAAKARAALDTLIGAEGDNAGWQAWLALAEAQMSTSPPQPKRALQAAWMAFTRIDQSSKTAATDQVSALRVMDRALLALNQPVPELEVLQAIARRQPQNPAAQQAAALAQQKVGLVFRHLSTDAEAFPARACLGFLGNPSSSPDFHAQDWVRLAPPLKDAAVTLESRRICITGLPAGALTTVTILHGMPGDQGISLHQDLVVRVAMPDRQPRLVFDNTRFIQPRGAAATVALDTVNLSAVKLTLVHVGERNLLSVMSSYPPGQLLDGSAGTNLAQNQGKVVWTGSAAVTSFTRNALEHVVLPLPPVMTQPGLYALVAAPGDGTPFADGSAPGAVQMILRTDLAPTVWHGAEGDTIQLRSFASGLPLPGAVVDLIAADNEILGSATTDADGVVRFAQALLAGQNGLAPAALHIRGAGGDFTTLDLTAPDFDLTDRGVSGAPQPGPVDPFIWTDRGIYRPGETVQVMALIRDEAGAPVDLPLHLVVTRADGRIYQDTVPPRAASDAIHAAVALSTGAPFGTWTVALKTDPDSPAIASQSFQVDAFVPPRLAVDFPHAPAILEPGRVTRIPVAARFLYGAPGSGLSGSGTITFLLDPKPFAGFTGYRFGLADEVFSGKQTQLSLATTDAQGQTTLPADLSKVPDTSGAIKVQLAASIDDPAGRSVSAETTVPVRPAAPLIGIAEDFAGDAVNEGSPAGFRIVAVAPDGKRVAMPVQLRLVRREPDWRLVVKNGQASYETVWRDEPVASQDVTLPASGAPYVFSRSLPFGTYRLQVLQASGGLAGSSVIFYSGWAAGDNPAVPARVSVRSDRRTYKPGDTATIHVEAPFAGPATVLVMTDRIKRLIDLPAAGATFDVRVPVSPDWGPGAYIGVHVFRPGGSDGKTAPARAIGLTWVGLDPAPRTLPLSIATAPIYRPRTTATILVHTTPGAWVTLAAVDEGILGLTQFETPEPLAHFFGQRTLGVGIHDDFARLLTPAGAANTYLRQGAGAEFGPTGPIPQTIVSLFDGPVQAGPGGIARFPLALPDFDGELRLMAVGWDGNRTGSAAQDITTRDPLIAEPLLPRFLAPGDQAQIGILLQNLELPAGPVSLHLATAGAISLAGAAPGPVTLAPQQRLVVPLRMVAGSAGAGRLTIGVEGPGGFKATHEATISVHPARPPTAQVTPLTLAPEGRQTIGPDASAFVPGTWTASASFGLGVRYDAAALVRALAAYPLNCLEQLTSRGLPLAMLTTGTVAGPDRAGQLQKATEAVLDRQRYDGAFGLWSSTGDAQPWLTAYATDFLLRARDAGAAVPGSAITQALGWLAGEVAAPPQSASDMAAQAYALDVLALAGQAPAGAIRVAADAIGHEPTPLARAQIAAALARLGEDTQARSLFTAVLSEPGRQDWPADYGSALRDQFATAVLVQESGLLAHRLSAIRAALPGANLNPDGLNTQEQAWGGAAAAALGAGAPPVSVVADGKTLGPAPTLSVALTGMTSFANPGQSPLPGSLVVQGVPLKPLPAARTGMQIKRQFFTLDGTALNPDKLAQNTVFMMVIEGRATDGQDHQAMVIAGLPAGWEIAGHFPGGAVPGMDWLGTLSTPDSQAAADDRYAAALTLGHDQPDFRLAVMVRAVTPGTFEYPGMALADMYRPQIFARQSTVHITVLPPAP
ncbi:MAG: alpha-2-macroglobulin family protein [Proteobacteria bacterium]|nr:alpha-2-macroglobulin family protein [Pseudomonadota bacterium]